MDGEVIGLVGVIIVQGGLLWYKLGRCEQKIEDVCKTINGKLAGKEEEPK